MGKKDAVRLRVLLLFLALSVMATAAAASSHNLGALIGNTSDASTGLPVGNANVSLEATSAQGDKYSNLSISDGSYAVKGIPPANYDISAAKPGYRPQFINNQPITPFQTVAINFSLTPDAQQLNVSGYVVNLTYYPVANATVTIAAANRSARTDGAGFYAIANLTPGTYDLIAGKQEDGYEEAVALSQVVPGTVNFTLVKSRRGCNDDCTKQDGLCHQECEGKGMCRFYSQETAKACNFAVPGIVDYGQLKVNCCSGAPYAPVKSNPQISCGQSVISFRLPVLFKGRFATMVITVFDALGCTSN